MSISLIAKPKDITPAYNPIVWEFDSTNSGETGFKYVIDVYDGSSTKIAEYRVSPRVGDLYGVIDLSRLLQSKVSSNLDLTNTTYYDASPFYYEYELKIGEEYNVSYAYTGFTQSGDYVQLTGFSSHPFVVGDQIDLTEGTPTNDLLAGLHTVVAVAATTVTIDVIYDDMISPSTTAGELIYADNRKSLTRDLSTQSNFYAFKGAVKWIDRKDWDDADYTLDGTTKKFLTNIPDNFYAKVLQEIIVAYIPDTTSTRRMYFENSNGDTFYKTVTPSAGETINYSGVWGSSIGLLTVISGTLPVNKSDTEWIEFALTDGTNTKLSETKRIYLDKRCNIEDFEILFLDRLGTYASFNFMLKAQEKETVKREVYNQHYDGSVSSTIWTYDSTDKGYKVHSVDISKEFQLNTNWMTQEMNEYFAELVSSPETYLYIDGVYQSCLIKDSSSEIVRQRGKNLIRKTITVELANRDTVNG